MGLHVHCGLGFLLCFFNDHRHHLLLLITIITIIIIFRGEGKPFPFGPLRAIFGHRHVHTTPQPGAIPLLGLENKRLAILDEFDFDERTLPLPLQ